MSSYSGDVQGAMQYLADEISQLTARVAELGDKVAAHKSVIGTILPEVLLQRDLLVPDQWAEIIKATADDTEAELSKHPDDPNYQMNKRIVAALRELSGPKIMRPFTIIDGGKPD
jgi:hypothetical protein